MKIKKEINIVIGEGGLDDVQDTKFMIKIESVMYPVMNYKYSPIVKSSEDHIDSAVSKFLTDQLFPLLMKIKMDQKRRKIIWVNIMV